ncbi:hypothetical protein CA85_13370 [Allorhodopirellula solitaria]|uniref:Uncharacterized protein n=1 Tax=Allorhodopirellula solitaria TaxID=2527987 RepID=A0A5C5YAZ0_9BACT|nr:hypothetical protein CA85_13370 [Allorhodopirellula solitaria]
MPRKTFCCALRTLPSDEPKYLAFTPLPCGLAAYESKVCRLGFLSDKLTGEPVLDEGLVSSSTTHKFSYADGVEDNSRWSSVANTTGNAKKHACQPRMGLKIIHDEVCDPLRGRRSTANEPPRVELRLPTAILFNPFRDTCGESTARRLVHYREDLGKFAAY